MSELNISEIKKYLEVIRRSVEKIEQSFNITCICKEMNHNVITWSCPVHGTSSRCDEQITEKVDEKLVENPQIPKKLVQPQNIEHREDRKKHISDLMAIDCWPAAISERLAASQVSEEDHIKRANAVLNMMLDRPIKDVNFLDFGCGDGWIAKQALSKGAAKVTGFDIIKQDLWQEGENLIFTDNIRDLEQENYDMILLYDVLDHSKTPEKDMFKVMEFLKPNGIVYVRCHPWTSKHGAHLWKSGLNKSYMQLFLTWDELTELGHQPIFTRSEKDPVLAYKWWFSEFKIEKERFHQKPVHEFFLVKAFKDLLTIEQELSKKETESLLKTMEIEFIDYFLTKRS